MEDCAICYSNPVFLLSLFLSVQGSFFLHLCCNCFVYQYNSFIYSLRISDTWPMYFSHTDLIVLSLTPPASLSTTPSPHHVPFFFMCLNSLNPIILKYCFFFTISHMYAWYIGHSHLPPPNHSCLSSVPHKSLLHSYLFILFCAQWV